MDHLVLKPFRVENLEARIFILHDIYVTSLDESFSPLYKHSCKTFHLQHKNINTKLFYCKIS
jgi:hypothetical protein